MNAIIAALRVKWQHFDPKMKYQLLSGLVAYAVLKLGVHLDPVLEGVISLGIGGAVGYAVPNEASELRAAQNGVDPEDVDIPNAAGLTADDPLAGVNVDALAAKENPPARRGRAGKRAPLK